MPAIHHQWAISRNLLYAFGQFRRAAGAAHLNVAATADQQAAVLLTIDGVWLATKGYADDIQKEGLQPLRELIASFVENGGEIWACGACTKPRGIGEESLIAGARIVTAAFVVEQLAAGAATLEW